MILKDALRDMYFLFLILSIAYSIRIFSNSIGLPLKKKGDEEEISKAKGELLSMKREAGGSVHTHFEKEQRRQKNPTGA